MNKVAVVILNYNTSHDCRKCVSFLQRQVSVELEIVIVDNCSHPDDVEQLRGLCVEQGCTLIENHENRGYNAGNNIGLRYAASKGYEYAMIANPDMEFPQVNYIIQLINILKRDEDIVAIGSNIIDANGQRQNPRKFTTYREELCWFISGLKKILKLNSSRILQPINQYCDILMGSCIVIRVNFIKQIGYFDENIFLYCEEPIFGKQVVAAGKKMYYFHDVTAIHAHYEKEKGSFIKRHNLYYRSRWYYITHYSGYNHIQLILMWLSRKVYYAAKHVEFIIKGIK